MNMHVGGKAAAKFRVGDRVRVVDSLGGGAIGDIATVVGVSEHDGDGVFYELDGLSRGAVGLYEYRLKPAPLFAVGNRVRIASGPDNGGFGEIGDVGIVEQVTNDDVYMRFESGDEIGDSWWVAVKHLEPAPIADATGAPLKIEAGKYYRTRDGRKVGPMRANLSEWSAPSERGALWHSDGRRFTSDGTYPSDLVAEWPVSDIAETTPPIAEQKAGKFKVGDRVRAVKGTALLIKGRDYTVVGLNGKGEPLVDVKDGSNTHRLDYHDSYFVHTPNPAIVAKLDNGQPKPATRPYVHADTASATTEAARLADIHKGQEFGVYELVATRKEPKVYDHEWQWLAASGDRDGAAELLHALTGMHLNSYTARRLGAPVTNTTGAPTSTS